MARSIAQKKGAKAARRKKLLAERRSTLPAETGSSLARQVRMVAGLPIHSCLVQDGLFERGNEMVMLIRGTGIVSLTLAAFLVDVYCLGVKDVVVHEGDEDEIEAMVAAMGYAAPLTPVEPAYARKLLRDVVAWARTLGIEPAADYAAADLLFGDVSADACDTVFTFGQNGKPVYMPDPSDTPARIRRQLEQLRRRLGPDGFDFVEMAGDEDDFAEFDTDPYDPDHAPDPAEWLAADEQERIIRVEDYHSLAGIELPNAPLHATFHAIVENQIAAGDPPSVARAVERLQKEGLDRHDAIHAVGSVLIGQIHDAIKSAAPPDSFNDSYIAEVEALTAEAFFADRKGRSDPEIANRFLAHPSGEPPRADDELSG